VVGQRTDSSDTRRIEISQFLHLSVVAYHQTQLDGDGPGVGGGTLDGPEYGGAQSAAPQLSDLADANVQEYYNLPEDDELAAGLEEVTSLRI